MSDDRKVMIVGVHQAGKIARMLDLMQGMEPGPIIIQRREREIEEPIMPMVLIQKERTHPVSPFGTRREKRKRK